MSWPRRDRELLLLRLRWLIDELARLRLQLHEDLEVLGVRMSSVT